MRSAAGLVCALSEFRSISSVAAWECLPITPRPSKPGTKAATTQPRRSFRPHFNRGDYLVPRDCPRVNVASLLEDQPILPQLRDDPGVAVRDFADRVLDGAAEDDRDLGRREVVVLLEPLPEAGRGRTQRILERAAQPTVMMWVGDSTRGVVSDCWRSRRP